MSLTRLPPELLETVVSHTLPEGFESLAVTCKKIYALCLPFMQHHNALRARFQHFAYSGDPRDPSNFVVTAGDLIRRIAIEPIIARYIRQADFRLDTPRSYIATRPFMENAEREDVTRLFANSPYLRQAGLDWKEWVDKIEEELDIYGQPCYSQLASAFLLTLLPNVESLILPKYWKSLDATDKLIDIIVDKTKQSNSPYIYDMLGLAQLTHFEQFGGPDLGIVTPFLALSHVRSFCGRSCVAKASLHEGMNTPSYRFGETLQSVSLMNCCLDERDIAVFLKDTKRLQTLRYSHSAKGNNLHCWDIGRLIAAIERQVGDHLLELSIATEEPLSFIAPDIGVVSMRGFKCLRQLEFSLQVVLCNSSSTHLSRELSHHGFDVNVLFISNLVPPSVSVLSLISGSTDLHHEILDAIFVDFAARKKSMLPALKEIFLRSPDGADAAYKDEFAMLLTEIRKADVAVYLEDWRNRSNLKWGGGL